MARSRGGDNSLRVHEASAPIFPIHYLPSRSGSSPGLWMALLIPLACCPTMFSIHSGCRPSPWTLGLLALQVGIASIPLLFNLSQKAKRKVLGIIPETTQGFKWFAAHPLLPPLITFIVLAKVSDLSPYMAFFCSFMCHYIHFTITEWLVVHFGKSFSIGEALLVGQTVALALTLSIKGLFTRPRAYVEYQQLSCFVQIALITATVLALILWRYRFHVTMLTLLPLVVLMGTVGLCVSSILMYEYSPVWLFHTLTSSPTRIGLVGWWANMSFLIILVTTFAQRNSKLAKTVVRKVFHILMVLLLIPGVLLDPALTYLASTGAVVFFTLLEFVRAIRIEPVSSILTTILEYFLDEKDSGVLILSHIYLLAGLICPLWLYPCSFHHIPGGMENTNGLIPTQRWVAPISKNLLGIEAAATFPLALPFLSGVLSVGIGDTAASIGGTYFGWHKWRGSEKTIEGTLFGMLMQLLILWLGVILGLFHFTWPLWGKVVIGVVICSLAEAFTDQVDNVALPLLLYTPLMDF